MTQSDIINANFNYLKNNSLSKQMVTNCITEIPQRIKLELNNGTLTLKAGSQVIVPNGFEADGTTPKFDYVTIDNDVVAGISGSAVENNQFIAYNVTNGNIGWSTHSESGTSSTATSTYTVYYNTQLNKIGISLNSTTIDYNNLYSLPFSICTNLTSSQGWKSIDQVFNGIGYIGSTVWVDKGVKGLIPDGRNNDGSLRNIECTTKNLFIDTVTYSSTGFYNLTISDNYISRTNLISYDEKENKNINTSGGVFRTCIVADLYYTNGVITMFAPKQAVHLANVSMCDGQWKNASRAVFSGTMETGFNQVIDLSNYLPNDGYQYEILVVGYIRTGNTSGNAVGLYVSSTITPGVRLGRCVTRTASNAAAGGSAIVVIDTDRYLRFGNQDASGVSGTCGLGFIAYRRLGKGV